MLVNSGSRVKVEELLRRLSAKTAETYPPEPDPWRPAAGVPESVEPILGRWWSEGWEYVIRYTSGRLELRAADSQPALPPSVFEPAGDDRFRGVSGPEEGELLEVVRGPDGSVEKLYWATYPLTRVPRVFGG